MINKRALAVTGIVLLLAAYVMLWPGLTKPMLSIAGTVEKEKLVDIGREILRESRNTSPLVRSLADRFIAGLDTAGTVEAFNKTNSILGTANELWSGGNRFVAVLIVSFSVVIPCIKALLLAATALPLPASIATRIRDIANASGKWSMADVFVIAIFVAFLAGKGMSTSRGLVDFTAEIGPGFWWFLAYCLLSIIGAQVLAASRHAPPAKPRTKRTRTSGKKTAAKKASSRRSAPRSKSRVTTSRSSR